MIAEGGLPVLFAFTLDLQPCCVEVPQPPGNPNGSKSIPPVVEDLTGGTRQQIAAGTQAPLRFKPI